MMTIPLQQSFFPELERKLKNNTVVNVASIPQRSPFRYPGGKTWLVPTARKWFSQANEKSELIEPFAGGGIISLTAAAECFFDYVTMVELDDDVASAWQTIFSETDCQWLIDQIRKFEVSTENINKIISLARYGTKELALATIVRNRTNHGGILAKGSGRIKTGESGKGIASRWYPETIANRISEANKLRNKITFIHDDAFKIMDSKKDCSEAFFFIDPPYTVAGKRLYNLFKVNHCKIFEFAGSLKGHFLLTYDNTDEIRRLSADFNLQYRTIPMQTTHLIKKEELLISDNFDWFDNY